MQTNKQTSKQSCTLTSPRLSWIITGPQKSTPVFLNTIPGCSLHSGKFPICCSNLGFYFLMITVIALKFHALYSLRTLDDPIPLSNFIQQMFGWWMVVAAMHVLNDQLRKLMMWVNHPRVLCLNLCTEELVPFATFHRLLEIHLPFSDQEI